MKHLDLFSGIGGFALAARWVGWETVGFCEIEPYCQKVLAKHWPGVPIYEDVKIVRRHEVPNTGHARIHEQGQFAKVGEVRSHAAGNERHGLSCSEERHSSGYVTDGTTTVGPVDIITGGFPCQDISYAGKGAGIEGERSGLWTELARIIGEVRPRWAVLENVAALLGRGLDRVTGDLAEIGYDCEWHCIPASAVGAPHRRDRIWIIAYPGRTIRADAGAQSRAETESAVLQQENGQTLSSDARPLCADVADTDLPRLERWIGRGLQKRAGERAAGQDGSPESGRYWHTEPDVGRVAPRVSVRLDGGRLDGSPTQGGTRKILRHLRDSLGTEAHANEWQVRGLGGIQAEKALLTKLCEHQGGECQAGHISLESKKTPEVIVRSVWFDGSIACPSCRRQSEEQRGREHPNTMRLLSQLLACSCGSTWLDGSGTTAATNRVDRLRGLGNAIVPQVAHIIFEAINEIETIAGEAA